MEKFGSPALPHSLSNTPKVELSSFKLNDQLKIVRALHGNKAHICDDISICMIKICDQSIVKSLFILSQNCLNRHLAKIKHCSSALEKCKQVANNNYRPVYTYLFCLNVEKPGMSACKSQLLSICHEIYASFVTLGGAHVCLIVYLAVHQMK